MGKRFATVYTHSVHTQDAARNVLPILQEKTYRYVYAQYANAILQARAKGQQETGRVRLFVEEHHKKEVFAVLNEAFTEQMVEEIEKQPEPQEEKVDG